jgi:hypothetical protein
MSRDRKSKYKPDVTGLPRIGREFDLAKVPFAGSSSLSAPFLDETIQFWQPKSERVLTREDAREMIENVTGFFSILHEWLEAERVSNRNGSHVDAGIESSDHPDKRAGRRNKKRVMP